MIGQIASTVGTLGVGLFCVMFIAFFFIKSDGLFSKIVCALVPDKYEEKASKATANIEYLLSRYFFGIVCEILLVALLDFLGLWAVARLGFSTALGIGFMCGIMNVIPYVGPWLGGALGTVLGISLKYSQAVALGGTFNFWVTLIILICCFVFTQWIDNFGLQPLIYSTSIKSTPLEIFIVIILAGKIGGILGMVAAVPAYTVIRVVAAEFFSDVKAVRRLIQASEKQPEPQPSDNGKIEGK
jgi:predicted PurR-regulated permease PerM